MVTVSRADDRLIAVKHVAAEHARDVEREADLLKQLDHPRIVRFVDMVMAPDGGRILHTLFVSSDTWATRPLTDPRDRAEGVAALAAVVADLHDVGVTHRNLTPGHIIHGDDDRPVLCSLTRAGDASQENVRIDLAALADLTHDDEITRGPLAGKLSSLADEMRAGQLSPRDLARRLDRLLARKVQRSESARSGSWRARFQKTPKKSMVAGGLGLAAIIIGAMWSIGRLGQTQAPNASVTAAEPEAVLAAGEVAPQASEPASVDQADTTDGLGVSRPVVAEGATPDTSNATTGAAPDATGATTAAGASPDTSGATTGSGATPDVGEANVGAAVGTEGLSVAQSSVAATSANSHTSSADGMSHEAGLIMEHEGRVYSIGAPGDIVVTGDWNCDGDPTPAIIRPSTGAVALFEEWPGQGETIFIPAQWHVAIPSNVIVERYGTCDVLRIDTANGSQLLDPKAVS